MGGQKEGGEPEEELVWRFPTSRGLDLEGVVLRNGSCITEVEGTSSSGLWTVSKDSRKKKVGSEVWYWSLTQTVMSYTEDGTDEEGMRGRRHEIRRG